MISFILETATFEGGSDSFDPDNKPHDRARLTKLDDGQMAWVIHIEEGELMSFLLDGPPDGDSSLICDTTKFDKLDGQGIATLTFIGSII